MRIWTIVLHEARHIFMLLLIQKGGEGVEWGEMGGGEMNGQLSCVPRGEEEEEKEKGGAIREGGGEV